MSHHWNCIFTDYLKLLRFVQRANKSLHCTLNSNNMKTCWFVKMIFERKEIQQVFILLENRQIAFKKLCPIPWKFHSDISIKTVIFTIFFTALFDVCWMANSQLVASLLKIGPWCKLWWLSWPFLLFSRLWNKTFYFCLWVGQCCLFGNIYYIC